MPKTAVTPKPDASVKAAPKTTAKTVAKTTAKAAPTRQTTTRKSAPAKGPRVPVFQVKAATLDKVSAGSIVVGCFSDGTLSASAVIVDKRTGGAISRAIKSKDISGKKGSATVLRLLPEMGDARVVVTGLGKADELNSKTFIAATQAAARALFQLPAADCVWTLHESAVKGRDQAWAASQSTQALIEAGYRFDQCKTSEDAAEATGPAKVFLDRSDTTAKLVQAGVDAGRAIGLGMNLAKDLGNLPGNICTPTYLAQTAKELARTYKLGIDVLEQKHMEALGMGSLLSVAKGSVQPPKLIVLKYNGGPVKQAPTVLVGKGITFDTGGISLKPGAEMDEMKFDMCGAASVLGTMKAVAELGLKLNVIGVVPTCENMPAGNASKPGDIVTSMSGQTIEILNTDAEGRLILCDALTYTERFKPDAVVDIATLTGACVIALGSVNSGLFSADDELATELLNAGQTAGDPAWRMPLDEEYHDQLKSNFADIANIGGRMAGSVTAACFLAKFTKKYRWAHLDIAGTAWKSGAAKGSSGRPVPLLMEFLKARAK